MVDWCVATTAVSPKDTVSLLRYNLLLWCDITQNSSYFVQQVKNEMVSMRDTAVSLHTLGGGGILE